MAVEFSREAGDLSDYAKKCREALNDEKPEETFNFHDKLLKLIDKAQEEGIDVETIILDMDGVLQQLKGN